MGLRPRYRYLLQNWYMLLLTTVILLLLLLKYQSSSEKVNGAFNDDLAQQEAIDKDLHRPIEEAIARLFPAHADDVRLMLEQENISRWQKWLQKGKQPTIELPNVYNSDGDCAHEPLPLSILRRVIADSQDIKDYQTFVEPMLIIPNPAQTMCIRAIIPPLLEISSSISSIQEDPYHYLYQPFLLHQKNLTSPWWDSLLISARHIETGSSLQLHMQPWVGHKLLRNEWRKRTLDNNKPAWVHDREQWMHERLMLHVYEASITLNDPGHYEFEGRLEYQDGLWNFEKGPIVAYQPRTLKVLSKQEQPIAVGDPVDTQEIVQQHLQLPLCTGADHAGRWLPAPPGFTDLVTDKDGKFWAPFDCHYQRISYSDFAECLAEKYSAGIDMYGDSNTRRSIKKMVTSGRWCEGWHEKLKETVVHEQGGNAEQRKQQQQQEQEEPEEISVNTSKDPRDWTFIDNNIRQLRSCYCEDFHEPGWNPLWFDAQERRNAVWLKNSTGHDRALLRSYKWDGLTYLNDPSWTTAFTKINATFDISHPGDVVIFSLGNWDAAYMSLYEFNKELDKLLGYITTAYAGKQIVYRTPQYYCCRADNTKRNRLLSSSRVQAFNDLAKDKFTRVLGARVWDTMILGESRTWEEKLQARDCPSNHATPDVVEIENQILMNALCNNNT